MISPVDLEKAFDGYFEGSEFRRVSELVGYSPHFENADYINTKLNVIVELKIIDKDFFKDGGIIDRLHGIVPVRTQPFSDIVPGAPGLYYLKFPPKNREGNHDQFEEPIRRSLKKANRQIKATKNALLSDKDAFGIVIIALNMPTLIDLPSMYELVAILAQEFSSITGFLVCVPKLALEGANESCFHGVYRTAPDIIQQLCHEMGDYFCEYFYALGRRLSDGQI